MGTNPSNLTELSESMESVLPLLQNLGSEPDAVEGKMKKYAEVVRHIIRARAFYYMGMIEQQIEEYRKALVIEPGDDNTAELLKLAQPRLDE